MDKTYEKKVGQNIRFLRKQNSLTQDLLVAKMQTRGCDITRSALAKIEVGQRHLYPDELKTIKDILKVSYNDILEGNFPK